MEGAAILSSLAAAAAAQTSPLSVGDVVGMTGPVAPDLSTGESNPQRKITLLTRPPAPPVASSVASATPGVASIIGSSEGNPLISELPQSVGSGLVIAEVLPTPGRAARNDYYDTEDPSVNLHEFIINSLQAQKNRVVLLKLEEEFLTYVTDPKRVDPLKLPPWDSYHRMLAHRVAAYFGLEHNVDPVDKSCVVVCKGPQTRVPLHRFSDFLTVDPDSDPAEPKLILKRSPREIVVPLDKSFEALSNLSSDVKSFEEREEEYEKTRARIFSQHHQPLQGSHTDIAFDLASAPHRPRSSLLPAIMQHRRTVSDTLLFRRPSVLEELMKDAPNSSHSSRSATPLMALLQPAPTGDAGIVGGAAGSKVTPQHSPQQQKIVCARELPSSQPQIIQQQQQQQQQQQYSSMRPQNRFTPRQRPSNVSSFQFQPLPGRGVPVFYPQQTTIMADPSWYYNNMMLYQVSPQQFIPAASGAATPYGQMIQPTMFPFNQHYPISPGVVAHTQSPIMSPPISTPRPGYPTMRIPMGGAMVEGGGAIPPSPPHLPSAGGVTLVRPVAHVATPTGGSFKFDTSPTSMVPHGAYTVGQPVGGAMLAGGMGQQGRSFMAGGGGQLVEHMEQLSLDGRVGEVDMRLGQIGEGKKVPPYELGRNGKPGAVVNGSFTSGYAMMSAIEAGQMMSPTQIHPAAAAAPLQFLPHHLQHHPHMIPGSPQDTLVSPQHVPPPGTPGGVVHFPQSQSPSGPTTPPVGSMGFPTLPGMLAAQQQQNVFSPTTTHSPVQILGHTLGTSLFSPPPSSSAHPGMFINSPTTGGKIIGYPTGSPTVHAPVGSGLRFRRYESPKQAGHALPNEVAPVVHGQTSAGVAQQFIPESPIPASQPPPLQQKGVDGVGGSITGSSGFQPVQLPPRLASQQQTVSSVTSALPQRNTGTRYQNQRHPANRGANQGTKTPGPGGGNGNGGSLVAEPGQFLQLSAKKEPLLPTPPNIQMVKLDTTLTCGVPLHVMEIVSLPPEGSPERQHAYQMLRDVGALDIKGGRINKTGEEVLIAIFPIPDLALKALQMQNMPYTLSIPRNHHAKFILSLIQGPSVQ